MSERLEAEMRHDTRRVIGCSVVAAIAVISVGVWLGMKWEIGGKPAILIVSGVFLLFSAMETFDKRIEQMKKGAHFWMFPAGYEGKSWPVAPLLYWVPLPSVIALAILDWRWALFLYAAGFIFATSQVFEWIGYLLIGGLYK